MEFLFGKIYKSNFRVKEKKEDFLITHILEIIKKF